MGGKRNLNVEEEIEKKKKKKKQQQYDSHRSITPIASTSKTSSKVVGTALNDVRMDDVGRGIGSGRLNGLERPSNDREYWRQGTIIPDSEPPVIPPPFSLLEQEGFKSKGSSIPLNQYHPNSINGTPIQQSPSLSLQPKREDSVAFTLTDYIHPEFLSPSVTPLDLKPFRLPSLTPSFALPRNVRGSGLSPPIQREASIDIKEEEEKVIKQEEEKDRIRKISDKRIARRSIAPSPGKFDDKKRLKFELEKSRSEELKARVKEEEDEKFGKILPPPPSTTTTTTTNSRSRLQLAPSPLHLKCETQSPLPTGIITSKYHPEEFNFKDEEKPEVSSSLSSLSSRQDSITSLREVDYEVRDATIELENRLEQEVENELIESDLSELSEEEGEMDLRSLARKQQEEDSGSSSSSEEEENNDRIAKRLRKSPIVKYQKNEDEEEEDSDFTDSDEEERKLKKESLQLSKGKKKKKGKEKKVVAKVKKEKVKKPVIPLPPPPPPPRPFGIKARLQNQLAIETSTLYPPQSRVPVVPLVPEFSKKKGFDKSDVSNIDFEQSLQKLLHSSSSSGARPLLPTKPRPRTPPPPPPPTSSFLPLEEEELEDYVSDNEESGLISSKPREVSPILGPQTYFDAPTLGGAMKRWYLEVAGEQQHDEILEIADDYNYKTLSSDRARLQSFYSLETPSLFNPPRSFQLTPSNPPLLILKPGGPPSIYTRNLETPLQILWSDLLQNGNPSKPRFEPTGRIGWEEKKRELGERGLKELRKVINESWRENMELIESGEEGEVLKKVWEGNWIWFMHIELLAKVKQSSIELSQSIDLNLLERLVNFEEEKLKDELRKTTRDLNRSEHVIEGLKLEFSKREIEVDLLKIEKDKEMVNRLKKRIED